MEANLQKQATTKYTAELRRKEMTERAEAFDESQASGKMAEAVASFSSLQVVFFTSLLRGGVRRSPAKAGSQISLTRTVHTGLASHTLQPRCVTVVLHASASAAELSAPFLLPRVSQFFGATSSSVVFLLSFTQFLHPLVPGRHAPLLPSAICARATRS